MQLLSSDHLLNYNYTTCVCSCVFVCFLIKNTRLNFSYAVWLKRSQVDMSLMSVTLLNPVKMFSFDSHLGFYLFKCINKKKDLIRLRLKV